MYTKRFVVIIENKKDGKVSMNSFISDTDLTLHQYGVKSRIRGALNDAIGLTMDVEIQSDVNFEDSEFSEKILQLKSHDYILNTVVSIAEPFDKYLEEPLFVIKSSY